MTDLLRPLTIGGTTLPNNLVLSPMAGFTDLPFRILCRQHGAGLVSTEMVGVGGLTRDARKAAQRSKTLERERPTQIQLFGTDPEEAAAAARRVEDQCDVVGFNMGCPAWQIQRAGCGAALLDDPDRAVRIVEALRGSTRRPLLVKMRTGNKGPTDVGSFARRLEAAGADAIIVHGRTAAQAYSGKADWSLIRAVKGAVAIPVIGNGDVTDGPSAERALRESGADGVALGRATLGDPRVFTRIAHYLATGTPAPPTTAAERIQDFLAYVDMAKGEDLPVAHILHQAQRFTRGLSGAARIRARLHSARMGVDEIRGVFEDLLVPAA